MLPMVALRLSLGTDLAANATYLAPAGAANKIALIKAPFTPSEDMLIGSLTLADFDGSTPIAGATGAQQVATDPTTDNQVITIKPPLGGYRWVTTGLTHLPQAIYGYALVDDAGAVLLAVATLPMPISLNAIGQQIELLPINLTIVQQPVF